MSRDVRLRMSDGRRRASCCSKKFWNKAGECYEGGVTYVIRRSLKPLWFKNWLHLEISCFHPKSTNLTHLISLLVVLLILYDPSSCTPSQNDPQRLHATPVDQLQCWLAVRTRMSSLEMKDAPQCLRVSTPSQTLSAQRWDRKVCPRMLAPLNAGVADLGRGPGRNVIIEQPYGGPKITKGEQSLNNFW